MNPIRTVVAALGTSVVALIHAGCGVEVDVAAPPATIAPEVDRLANWLTGSFDSSAQAARDAAFLDISLNACRVWPSRTDGRWIYLEQARSDALDRPYRQRMYRVRFDADGRLVSEVFAFAEGMRPAAGSWRDPGSLDTVMPELLLPREGCAVHLRWNGGRFEGGTEGEGCESSLAGASYATSEVVIDATSISSWDRGFDATGTQVWGSEAGAYEFLRK
jgi:CpeT protein